MALIGLQDIHYTIGGARLFEGASLQIESSDRLCVVGRNGSGKSTLLALLQARIQPDRGEISRKQGLTIASLDQEPPGGLLDSALASALSAFPASSEPWEQENRAERYLTRLGVEPAASFTSLSGGNRRRVLLAGALAAGAELLLLDEPTNHLDIETISWLEEELSFRTGAVVFVTHDRRFAKRLANRVTEVDRGRLLSFSCGYADFLERRDAVWEAERVQEAVFEKKLAEEEAWLRRGVKARLKRNEGRVKALSRMREAWQDRRRVIGKADLILQQAERSGELVLEASGLAFSYPNRALLKDFTRTVMRGERIGLIGRNGSGKTSLLRLLFGELAPDSGSLKSGTKLQVLYFDQMRGQLDLSKSVRENVSGSYDTVEIGGKTQHVLGYLARFLFSPERAMAQASILSGGERARLLLAKLFTRTSNVLVLDEPTNDLDAETLDLLEDLLLEYSGTIFLVSHDREFLDNVVTSTWYLPGDGTVVETPGGWTDWEAWRLRAKAAAPVPKVPDSQAHDSKPLKPRRFGFKEKRELDALPDLLAALEAERDALHARLADPEFYRARGHEAAEVQLRLSALEGELAATYARWEELERLSTDAEKV